MNGFLFDDDAAFDTSKRAQQIKGIISRGSVSSISPQEIATVNIGAASDGSVHQIDVEQFGIAGVISIPALAIENEAIVANVGADDNGAVVVSIRDAARLAVQEKEPVQPGELMVYASDLQAENTKRIILTLEKIRAGNLNGNEKELAYLDALQSLSDMVKSLQTSFNTLQVRYISHFHNALGNMPPGTGAPQPILPTLLPNTATATIEGTDIFLAE